MGHGGEGVAGHGDAHPEGQPFTTISVSTFAGMGLDPSSIVHVTGFTNGMRSVESARQQALDRLSRYSCLTWGGDYLDANGFTVLVGNFLAEGDGNKRVFAFRSDASPDAHEGFMQSWRPLAETFRGAFFIVGVSVEAEANRLGMIQEVQRGPASGLPGGAIKFFLLGRLAAKITGTRRVVALGGGGIVGCEMRCGLQDGTRWTVFAMSRGRPEGARTLMDASADEANVELVRGVDQNEGQGFASGCPPPRDEVPLWCLEKILTLHAGSVQSGLVPVSCVDMTGAEVAAVLADPAKPVFELRAQIACTVAGEFAMVLPDGQHLNAPRRILSDVFMPDDVSYSSRVPLLG